MITRFDIEVAEVRAREDQMVALVRSNKEAIDTLKGFGFSFDLYFENFDDPFPSNLP